MFSTVISNRFFDFFPLFDFGKLWSFLRVKQPTRPLTDQERAERFHYAVLLDVHDFVHPDGIAGDVYISESGKVIYWRDPERDKTAAEAYYVNKSPEEILSKAVRGFIPGTLLGDEGKTLAADDRKAMLRDYYEEKKASALIAQIKFG